MSKTETKFELSQREERVVGTLVKNGGLPMTIAELAQLCFPKKGKGNSWVRNSLRRPRDRFGLAKKVANGTYVATKKALNLLADETSTETPVDTAPTEKAPKAVAAKRVTSPKKKAKKVEPEAAAKTETTPVELKPEPETVKTEKKPDAAGQPTLF